jgi:hypothetical protein
MVRFQKHFQFDGIETLMNVPPGSLLTGIIAMDQFQNTFGSGKTGPTVAVLFSLYTVSVLWEDWNETLIADLSFDIAVRSLVRLSQL